MILVKTEIGQQVLKDRSIRISPRQRSAFILFDGKRSVSDVIDAGMGISKAEIDQMVELGLLSETGGPNAQAATVPKNLVQPPHPAGLPSGVVRAAPEVPTPTPMLTSAGGSGRSNQQRYKDAYPVATRLSGSLGLRGFRLNLAVEGTSTYEELLALAPRIASAVGPEKAAELDRALKD